MTAVFRAKHFRKYAFNIHDGAGVRIASITLYNYGFATASSEAQEVAKLLTGGDWSVSRVDPENKASQFIDNHVEVRS